ncbi:MAG: hypothetical protein AAF799_04025 [Myxococcota bacterium]
MADSHGGGLEEPVQLRDDERAALAAWADAEPPDDFADVVAQAWALECGAEPEPVARPRTRSVASRQLLGFVAAAAAAILVLLLARGLPGIANSAPLVEARSCDHDALNLQPAEPPPPVSEKLQLEAMEPALAALTRHCAPCHDGRHDDGLDGALRVYDIRDEQFWQAMSESELVEANARMQLLAAADDDERRSMAAFVRAELDRRDRAG